MSRRLIWLALVAAAALTLAMAAMGAEQPLPPQPTLSESTGTEFPQRAYVLGLPSSTQLTAQDLAVLENGEQVNDLTVELPGTGGSRTAAVILIDASKSMEGDPIVKAADAAQAFATRLPSRIEVAVIPFNNKTPITLPLTTDPTRIANTLAKPPSLAYGTRINDAVAAAAKLLGESGVEIGSIVLLSDGADVGSLTDVETAVEAVNNVDARVFAIGLDSPQFDSSTLAAYASGTGGSYVLAKSPDDLTPIFQQLGQRISSQYLLRYQSFAGPGEKVYVTVRGEGVPGVATTSYTSPGLPVSTISGPSTWDRFIQSGWLAILVCAAAVGLIGWAVYTLVRLIDRRFENRMSAFIGMTDEEQLQQRQAELRRSGRESQEGDESSGTIGFRWYARLEDEVRVGRIPLSAGQVVALTALAVVGSAVVIVAITGLWWTALIGILPIIGARSYVNRKVTTLQREFAEQLPETIDVVSSALRSGHSLVGALEVAVDGAPEPSHAELGRALADERLGVPLDEALRYTAHRMNSADLTQVSLVARLQREAGTNSADVLDQVAENIRYQMELRRLIRSLTAQGRMSRWIVSLLPVGLFLALLLINPEYMTPLWDTTGGIFALIIASMMVITGSFVIKKIVEIEA